ncbi:MAG: DUF2127 domain-containing protein [Candidatus Freyarchaeum deiterrae]
MAFRPRDITGIAISLIIFAALGVIGAIFIEAVLIPPYQTSNYTRLLTILIGWYYSGAFLSQGELILISFQSIFMSNGMTIAGYLQFVHVGVLIVLAIVPLLIISAVGLFRMKRWGRYLGLVVGLIFIIGSIAEIIITITIGGIVASFIGLVIYFVPYGVWIIFRIYRVSKDDFE